MKKIEKMQQGLKLALLAIAFAGCQEGADKPGKQLEEIKTEGKIALSYATPLA